MHPVGCAASAVTFVIWLSGTCGAVGTAGNIITCVAGTRSSAILRDLHVFVDLCSSRKLLLVGDHNVKLTTLLVP